MVCGGQRARPAISRSSFALPWLIRSIFLALAIIPVSGCVEEDETEKIDRWARRVVPFEETWRRESEIPSEPQETPAMVLWEVSEHPPDTPPSVAEVKASEALLADCYRAALEHGWYDFETGLADGYQLMFQDRRHYENRKFILDDHVLDPDRPEFLMYYGTPKGKRLSGFMFYVDTPLGRGPQPGGNLTIWHYHIWKSTLCLLNGLISAGIGDANGQCANGIPSHRSPEMIHVWLIDHPNGAFTTSMMIAPPLFQELVEQRNLEMPETMVVGDR